MYNNLNQWVRKAPRHQYWNKIDEKQFLSIVLNLNFQCENFVRNSGQHDFLTQQFFFILAWNVHLTRSDSLGEFQHLSRFWIQWLIISMGWFWRIGSFPFVNRLKWEWTATNGIKICNFISNNCFRNHSLIGRQLFCYSRRHC